MRRLFLALTGSVAFACGDSSNPESPAAMPGTIAGVITSAITGHGLAGAAVTTAPTTVGATSDAQGFFRITNVAPRSYVVTASATGYVAAQVTVSVGDGETVAANIVLDTTQSSTPVQVTISPTSATLQVGAVQRFSATVSGTSNTAVRWKVNGFEGGLATVGKISTGGFYLAPDTVPSPNVVTVTATSFGYPLKSASAPVTITPGAFASIAQIGTLVVAGTPAGVLVDEKRNKIYVSDALGGTIQVFDGDTHALVKSISGCAGVLDGWVIDQAYGRIFAGCGVNLTSSVLDGDGKIRVIDTGSDAITAVIDVGAFGISFFKLAIDQTRHKVWVSHNGVGSGIAVVDVASNAVSPIAVTGAAMNGSLALNETTNKIYVVRTQYSDILEIDGSTRAVSRSLPAAYSQVVQSGINRRENKLYVKSIGGPNGEPTICIYNMNQAVPGCTTIDGEDWGGIVANETTNLVFVGVEVGNRIGVVDGASDRLITEIPMDGATGVGGSTSQSHQVVVNEATNHAFFVNTQFLLAVERNGALARRIAYSNPSPGPASGWLAQAIAINRTSNRVYVVYDGRRMSRVAVFQDR